MNWKRDLQQKLSIRVNLLSAYNNSMFVICQRYLHRFMACKRTLRT
jgi:hypothetical protein